MFALKLVPIFLKISGKIHKNQHDTLRSHSKKRKCLLNVTFSLSQFFFSFAKQFKGEKPYF